jgi:hypothetical protein
MDINDLKLLKFAKLFVFLDDEFKRTKSYISWDLGFASSLIMVEMMSKCSKASIIDKELGKLYDKI